MMFKVTARAALISTAAAVMFAAPSTVYAQQVSRAYNVPAQGLDAALKAIAAVSGEQIIYEPGSVRAKRSSAVVGNYSTDQAVTTALHGTGLSVSRSPRGVLVVTSRAAPAEQPRGEAEAGSAAAGNGDALPVDPVDQEIVVTGSHIRGAAPAGANLIVLNKKDLDQTGRGTLAEAIQTVPQVHGGGANARNLRPGPGAAPNMFGTAGGRGAASLNLRGLGVEETLTLVNGRRLAPAGSFGAIADISALPMEAVERIEILADGASATYGADAMAGVVNIIMDRRFHGAVTRLRGGIETRSGQPELQASQTIGWSSDRANILISADYAWQHGIKMKGRPYAESMDLRPMGGDDHRVSACNPGNIIYPFEMAGAIPSGQDGRTLEPDQIRHGEINRCERFPGSSHLIPETRRASVYLTGSYEVTDRLQLTGDALATKRSGRTVGPHLYTTLLVPVTNAYRQMNGFHGDTFPLDQPILIDYQFTQIEPKGDKDSASSLLGTIGATYVIGANW